MATADEVTDVSGEITEARLALSRLPFDGGLDEVFARATEISARALGVSRVGVWFFDFEKGLLVCRALYSSLGDAAPVPLQLATLTGYVAAVREQRFVATRDARVDEHTLELNDYLGVWHITSMLDAAVYRSGEVVGVVCLEHVGEPREWSRHERQFAATVADLVSQFLEVNDRLIAERHAHQLELKLKDAHRLDALGRMAAGVAHDLNTLLAVVTNGIAVLRRTNDPSMLAEMDAAAHHAAQLVAQLMTLGRRKTPVAMVTPVEQIIEALKPVLASQTAPNQELIYDIAPGLAVWADEAQLLQVLTNLVRNALQATPNGGPVVIRAHARKNGVLFEVIDTGEGISRENLAHLFDPFFTTRPSGTGIGLSLVQQLVLQHHGEVTVSSTPGDGATFRVWWPSQVP